MRAPRRVEIELEYAANHFRLKIRDNGRGFEGDIAEAGRPGHWGIPGMRERAERLSSRLQLRSRIGVGTEVDLVVPGHVAFQRTQTSRTGWRRRVETVAGRRLG